MAGRLVKEADKMVDVYFAISMWVIVSRRNVWPEEKIDLITVQARVMQGRRPLSDKSKRQEHPNLNFVESGWLNDPSSRPTFEAIYNYLITG